MAWPSLAAAETGVLLTGAGSADSAALATGQQLLLSGRSGAIPFGGRQVDLAGFTGVVGYANELAYVVVIEGAASVGAVTAKPGWLLILRPYGAAVSRERFDATRLSPQWTQAASAASPTAATSLEAIRTQQRRGVFLGRFGQTRFNVAASGSARHEKATRSLMGAPAVRDIRFSGASDPRAVEGLVAKTFVDALKSGDAGAVAALLDPTPFGGRALTGGGADARLLTASTLIASRDWRQVAGDAAPQLKDGAWTVGGATLQLRAIDDFVFVSRISGGKS